jgi:hypothetical protein
MINDESRSRSNFGRGLLSLMILCSLTGANWFALDRFWSTNYLLWFAEQGSLISISVAFVSLVWKDINVHPHLVSANPACYLSTCFQIVTGVFASMSTIFKAALSSGSEGAPNVPFIRLLWDTGITLVVVLLMFVIGTIWLIVVAPAMYFLTLITGAPARLGLLNPEAKETLIRESRSEPSGSESTGKEKKIIKKEYFNLTLCDKPVTLTFLISGAVLETVHRFEIDMWIAERMTALFS